MDRKTTPEEDDTIIIKCPDREDGTGRVFEFRHSVLKRSPMFVKFFESPYYLHGCDMRLTFIVDPAVCVDIAYKYLEEGPDLFQPTILRVQLTMRYKLLDRLIILIKLHALAKKLGLPGLMDMAMTVLSEADQQVTASACVTLASLVFAKMASFDRQLKEWCIDHVSRFLAELQKASIWYEVLWKTDSELQQVWARMLEEKRLLETADEEGVVDDGETHSVVRHHSIVSTLNEQSFHEVLDRVARGCGTTTAAAAEETDEDEEMSQEWCTTAVKHRGTLSKVNQLLGTDKNPHVPSLKRTQTGGTLVGLLPASPSGMQSPKAYSLLGYPGYYCTDDLVKRKHRRRHSLSSITSLLTPTKMARKTRWRTGF
ncbi:MAG: hypothetical protein Q9219_003329 [cf. Caloplaca sp. 3 TL-2023]